MLRSKGLLDSSERRAKLPGGKKTRRRPRSVGIQDWNKGGGQPLYWQTEDWARRTSTGTLRPGLAAQETVAHQSVPAVANNDQLAQPDQKQRAQSAVPGNRTVNNKLTWRENQNLIKKQNALKRPQSTLPKTRQNASRVALSETDDYSYRLNRRVNPSFLAYSNQKTKSTSQAAFALPMGTGANDAMPYLNSHIGWREPLLCTPYMRKFIIHNPEFKH